MTQYSIEMTFSILYPAPVSSICIVHQANLASLVT